jgi:predicted nucleic acid-binding Zn ribbon protein
MIEATGFCWTCGKVIKEGELFCNSKCKEQYERNLHRGEKTGKKAGYGLKGSCH